MSDNFEKFIESLESANTKSVVNAFKSVIEYDYSNYTKSDIENVILNANPNSPKAVITACYVLGMYARFIGNQELYQIVLNVDKNELWERAKPTAKKKFISHTDFEQLYHIIGTHEPTNSFYIQTIFRAVYEGIYNDDMSVLKNLRASDIHNDIVTLHDDEENTYELQVPLEFAEDLRELGTINYWERRNRFNNFKITIHGLHPDSCFKAEVRNDYSKYTYRYSYYRILRKISKDYLDYNLLPFQIYISGIMYRIALRLKEHGIAIKEAFASDNKNRIVSSIISDELKRSNCDTEVRNFREIVKGHLEVFEITQE